MTSRLYLALLFIALIAAACIGYSCGGEYDERVRKDYSSVQGYESVEYYDTVEAQGAPIYDSYNEFEASVVESITTLPDELA